MLNGASTVPASGGEPLLYVAELLHRVSNEYASAISLASVMASRAPSPEVRSALKTVIEHLVQLATAHRVLLPPVVDGTADLGDYLTRLCQAKVAVELERRGTTLRLAVVSPVALEHSRCWRVGLIVSELITNAARPACRQGMANFRFGCCQRRPGRLPGQRQRRGDSGLRARPRNTSRRCACGGTRRSC